MRKREHIVVLIIVFIIYFLFPNNNLSVDSYGFGSSVKYGEDLFSAHHLLYNYFNNLVFRGLSAMSLNIDALKLMQAINAVFALLSLAVLRRLLIRQSHDNDRANTWTLFVAVCFGVMRFAVEAEAYIIPIFFSLVASSFYLDFLNKKKTVHLLLCSIFISIACLFHQIHLFWGVGFFIGLLLTSKLKHVLLFSLPTLLVPLVYAIVLTSHYQIDFSVGNLVRFLGEYYYSDHADTKFGLINFAITPITFFRTFFQVHGIVLEILRLIPLFYLVIPIVLLLVVSFIIKMIRSIGWKHQHIIKSPFELTHLWIFMLQFAFAFYSHGNSEFMVMLPFVIPLFVDHVFLYDIKAIKHLMLAMLLWNFFFAIFPNHYCDYHNNKSLITVIENNPDKAFILKERNIVVNQYHYEIGTEEVDRLIDNSNSEAIKQLQTQDKVIYTDMLSKKVPFNRANVTRPNQVSNLVFIRHITKIDSELGGFYIDEVKLK